MNYNDRSYLSTSHAEPSGTFFQCVGRGLRCRRQIRFVISAENAARCVDDGVVLAEQHGQRESRTLRVEIFSRNLERTTPMFPDIVRASHKQIYAKRSIIEGQAGGFNEFTRDLYPFQVPVQRKRKCQTEEIARGFPPRVVRL
jgi:hypothetical protein